MPVVSLCTHFWQLCLLTRKNQPGKKTAIVQGSLLSSLVLFMLRCVYVDLGVLKLYNIMSRGGVNNVKPVPQAEVPEPEIGASCINTTSRHLWRWSEFTSLGPSRRAADETNVSWSPWTSRSGQKIRYPKPRGIESGRPPGDEHLLFRRPDGDTQRPGPERRI